MSSGEKTDLCCLRDFTICSSRTCGVEVDCHGAGGMMLFHFDNFAAGGANVMVQVLWQTLDELQKKLATQGFPLPSKLYLQFDNSGENKNKTMFAFLSHLVQSRRFDEIQVPFVAIVLCFNLTLLILG